MKKLLILFAMCLGFISANAQDFVRQTIGSTTYTIPTLQQRYSPFQFNPPLIFDIGGSAATQNIFQVVPLTVANTATFNVAAPGQATTYKFTDPGGANATFAFLEGTQTLSGTKTFSAAVTITPTASLTLGTAGTAVGQALFLNATSGSITVAPPTGALATPTITLPATTGGLPIGISCGAVAAAGACANTAQTNGKLQIYAGTMTLAGNTSLVTGLSPGFTSTSSYFCTATVSTGTAATVKVAHTSATSITVTNPGGGATDAVDVICIGT